MYIYICLCARMHVYVMLVGVLGEIHGCMLHLCAAQHARATGCQAKYRIEFGGASQLANGQKSLFYSSNLKYIP